MDNKKLLGLLHGAGSLISPVAVRRRKAKIVYLKKNIALGSLRRDSEMIGRDFYVAMEKFSDAKNR